MADTHNTSIVAFIPHKSKSEDTLSVWSHFLVAKNKSEIAKCIKCSQILQTKGGSKKGLHTHLKSHNVNLSEKRKQPSSELPGVSRQAKQAKITTFYESSEDKSLPVVLSRMIARDGFTFSIFLNSSDLRSMMTTYGLDAPKSRETIRQIMLKYYQKIKSNTIAEVESLKNQGSKFSLVFDEWTSTANKHFLNVNIFTENKFWNLGLIRYKTSMTAEVCVEILFSHLQTVNLNLSTDIVAITTDGASTMVKVGKLIEPYQQLCVAHGLQLAVIDVLYKVDSSNENADAAGSESESENSESEDEEGLVICGNDNRARKCTEKYNFNSVIKKVRSIARAFRKSPTKNDILQHYVKLEHGKELKLILDCKTRWNSMLDMLERFVLLEKSVKKASVDLKMHPLLGYEYEAIKEIVRVLHPVKITIEALCARNMDLFKCDVALNFMLQEIKSNRSALSRSLYNKLVERIKQRRTILSDVYAFLINPSNMYELKYAFSEGITMSAIREELESILRNTDNMLYKESDTNNNGEVVEVDKAVSLKEKLHQVLASSSQMFNNRNEYDLKKVLVKEIDIFCNGGDKGYYLQKAFNFLSTIQPTSVEAERCFSNAGFICNKFRSSLGDDTINAIISLRSHFKLHNK